MAKMTDKSSKRAPSPWRIPGRAALLSAGVLAIAAGAPVFGQTLTDALSQAYQTNPQLLAERARLRATDETVAQAISNWRPNIEVSGDVGWTRSDSDVGAGSTVTRRYPRGVGASITQNVWRGGSTFASVRGTKAQVKADRARLFNLEQSVLSQAATAFVNVVRDQAILELNVNNEKVLERQLEATQDRFRVGEVTRTDVAQAESRMSRARADRIQSEGNLISSRADYQNIIGELPGELEPPEPLTELPEAEQGAIDMARTSNFLVTQATHSLEVAEANVRQILGEMYPQVSLQSSYDKRLEAANANSKSDTFGISARVTVPLYRSGSVASRVRGAKEVVSQRRNELLTTTRDVIEQATRSWELLQTSRARIRAFSDEVRAATIALEGVEQEALVGSRTVLDVLDAEQELLNARVNLVTARRDEVVASYQLQAAVGGLTAEKLALPVELYDVEKHYDRTRGRWFGTGITNE